MLLRVDLHQQPTERAHCRFLADQGNVRARVALSALSNLLQTEQWTNEKYPGRGGEGRRGGGGEGGSANGGEFEGWWREEARGVAGRS